MNTINKCLIRNKAILYSIMMFFSHCTYAQWEQTTCSVPYLGVNARLASSDNICLGQDISIEFEAGQSPVIGGSENYKVQIWNNNNSYTGLEQIGTICYNVKPCSTLVAKANAKKLLSFTLPNNFSAGTYFFKIILDGSAPQPFHQECKLEHTFSVSGAPSPPSISGGTSPGSISRACEGESHSLSVSNCSGTVNWSTGQTGANITVKPTATTTYTATCQTTCGTSSNTATISPAPKPSKPTISGNNFFCEGGSTTITVNGGPRLALFSKQKGPLGEATSAIPLSVRSEDTYYATASYKHIYNNNPSDFLWCTSYSDDFTVKKSQPSVNISGSSQYCQGDNNTLNANINLTTDKPVTTFKWKKDGQDVGGNASSISAVGSGNYSITITDQIGCSATANAFSVTENPKPSINNLTGVSLSGIDIYTPNVNISGGTAPYSYQWNANPAVNGNGATAANPSFGPFSQANNSITLSVADKNGCRDTKSIPITWSPCTPPTVNVVADKPKLCDGISLKLTATATGGAGGYVYQWKKEGENIVAAIASSLSISEPGSYSIAVTDAKPCTANAAINVEKINAVVSITGKLEFCAGNSTQLTAVSNNTNGKISYKWVSNAGGPGIDVDASVRTFSSAGNYTVSITDELGCKATSKSVVLIQNPLPIANGGTAKSVTCAETYLPAGTATGGNAPYQYYWTSSPVVASKDTTSTLPTFGPFLQNTTVSVRVTDAKGCIGKAQSTVTYIPPNINVTLSGSSNFCSGKNSPLSVVVSNANLPLTKLSWQRNGQEITKDVNAFTATQGGSYVVQVIDSKGCTKNSDVLSVVENPTPSVNITGPSFFCYGSTATLTANIVSGTAPFSYNWKQSNSAVTGTSTLITKEAATYTLTVSDKNSCVSGASPNFNLEERGGDIVATTLPIGSVSIYQGESVVLNAILGNEYNYQWKRDGVNVSTASTYQASLAGTYTVIVSKGECSRVSEPIKVVVIPVTSIMPQEDINTIVYPNPTDGLLNISVSLLKKADLELKLVDTKGQILKVFELKNQFNYNQIIELSSIKAGIYLLQIASSNGVVKNIKILKN